MSRLDEIVAHLRERIPEARLHTYAELGTDVVVVAPEQVIDVLTALRDGCAFAMLSDLSAVDWYPREPRFDVNYHLLSMARNDRLRVKVQLSSADPRVPSAVAVWPTANWQEREAWDLMGIVFEGHPNPTRLLMPEEWIGHPLRKDYPIGGVPVEYKIEPAYVGDHIVSSAGRSASGGVPARLRRDRGTPSHWTWSGPPAAGVRIPVDDDAAGDAEPAPGGEDV